METSRQISAIDRFDRSSCLYITSSSALGFQCRNRLFMTAGGNSTGGKNETSFQMSLGALYCRHSQAYTQDVIRLPTPPAGE